MAKGKSKAKSKAQILIPDDAGGMTQVVDRRFESAPWPIEFEVPKDQADTWLRYLSWQCTKRGWNSSSIGQMDAAENSGSITLNTGGVNPLQLAVIWERKRGGPIKVRARSTGAQEFPLTQAQELFQQVNEQCRSGATERIYCRGHLHYSGLAWRGELWLDETIRLGPPSRQYQTALIGPRVIIVDAAIDCIGRNEALFVLRRTLQELSAFLTVVSGIAIDLPEQDQAWVLTEDFADCEVRSLGYVEHQNQREMPSPGTDLSMPLRQVSRPDFSLRGIDGTTDEIWLPTDVTTLWARYRALTPSQCQQFLQAALKWQEALMNWRHRDTLSVALMVVACEALKPADQQFDDHNMYHVVEAILGKAIADRLTLRWFRPQHVRSAHFHRGDFHGSEFLRAAMWSSYHDPTFDQARRELALVTQATIIEWLSKAGSISIPPLKQKKSLRRWVRQRSLIVLPFAMVLGIILGWFLNGLVSG